MSEKIENNIIASIVIIGFIAVFYCIFTEKSAKHQEVKYEQVCIEKKVTTYKGFHWVAFGFNKEFGTNCNHWGNKSKSHWGSYTETECVKYKWVKK